jgi:hypothetical protein
MEVVCVHVWKWNNGIYWNYHKKEEEVIKQRDEVVSLRFIVSTFVNVTMHPQEQLSHADK